MTLLPALFGRPWSFTLGLPAWRMEYRQQGERAIPNVGCRLMHFHTPLDACREAETRTALRQHAIAFFGGFVGDPVWSAASRAGIGKKGPLGEERGFVRPGASNSLRWTIDVRDTGEFESLWTMVGGAERSGAQLSIFLYGQAAETYEVDRGEQEQEAPITYYRLIRDHGEFPEP